MWLVDVELYGLDSVAQVFDELLEVEYAGIAVVAQVCDGLCEPLERI